jgi:WD40 repeat protein
VFSRTSESDCITNADIVVRDRVSGTETTRDQRTDTATLHRVSHPMGRRSPSPAIVRGPTTSGVMSIDGNGLTQLTSDPLVDWGPKWSPDGTRVLFTRFDVQPGCCHGDIYVMDANGANLTFIRGGDGPWQSPTWSPNGNLIALTLCCRFSYDIGVMNLGGTRGTT